ncbi:M14 family zinc carboxypeptidase [Nocardioides sp. R-C-SC26]|uniref:M14 family zinc carboxypeptidase n=1 Tax=Nocardioides sp. R-C-SC26 TaxID=2870414 RepID=UPI001E61819D|nr:M14 family zinc carboxypeptidase [Nocardioides sp. R-C-SC26]
MGILALASVAAGAPPSVAEQVAGASARVGQGAERVVIGHSVQGRPISAYRLGDALVGEVDADVPTVVVVTSMHGDEGDVRAIARGLIAGPPIVGLDLWVVPSPNPDGLAAGARANRRGVDLNRNFPYRWVDLDGRYESGAGPASEPETRALMRFLRRVRPDRLLSFHQPLYGVDTDTKDAAFARRIAAQLHLPRRRFDCGGTCHGTLTMWFNQNFAGSAHTVEYAARPSRRHLSTTVPRQILHLFGARRAIDAGERWVPGSGT